MNRDQMKTSQTSTTATLNQEHQVSDTIDFATLMANHSSFINPARNTIVEGTVVGKDRSGFFVDIRTKTDAFVPDNEADDDMVIGQSLQFLVIAEAGDLDGPATLSRTRLHARLDRERRWNELSSAKDDGSVLEATVKDVATNRGGNASGLIVTINGIDGFVPRSEVGMLGRLDSQKGKSIRVQVLEADPNEGRRGSLIASHKRAQEAETDLFIATLAEGSVLAGKVVRILDNGVGALVSLGGATGLVHRRELDGAQPKVGDEVQVKVIKIDAQNRKVSLSMKQVAQQKVIETLKVGEMVTGRVARIAEYGYFVELGGVDGLLHLSEIPGKRGVKETFTEGQVIEVRVSAIDAARTRVALSRRELTKKD
ncbi:MAG TPA: S1 RNA-binding domain-containing protein [Chroococcales cyanobacterium]